MKEGGNLTMKDIAQALGVSVATVSRALKDSPRISAEKREEAGSGAGRALAAEQLKRPDGKVYLLKIHHKILKPQCRPFSEGCRLRCLEMCICKCRDVLIFLCKIRKCRDRIYKQLFDKQKSLPHYDYVGVVSDIA